MNKAVNDVLIKPITPRRYNQPRYHSYLELCSFPKLALSSKNASGFWKRALRRFGQAGEVGLRSDEA